ncbi:MAG: F0F1 ATP synthase subunit B [Actinobacteria bacterium]|nr:F0F1 ATP synthase subunit B [Actinomycetota bacterium]
MELLTPEGGTLFWTALTFIALLIILRKVAWHPILHMLEDREHRIKESLDKAEKARIEAEKTLAEQAQIIKTAQKTAQEIIGKSQKSAESIKEDIVKRAHLEADKMLQKAKRDIELSRDKAMEDIQELAVNLSMMATEKLIGRSLDEKDHKVIISESLSKLEDMN